MILTPCALYVALQIEHRPCLNTCVLGPAKSLSHGASFFIVVFVDLRQVELCSSASRDALLPQAPLGSICRLVQGSLTSLPLLFSVG